MALIRAAAALLILSATGLGAETPRPDLICGGTAPNWGLELGAEAAFFSSPQTEIDYAIQHKTQAEGRRWPEVLTLLAPTDTALVILRPTSCQAGAHRQGWTVDILTQRAGEAIALTGCCRTRPTE